MNTPTDRTVAIMIVGDDADPHDAPRYSEDLTAVIRDVVPALGRLGVSVQIEIAADGFWFVEMAWRREGKRRRMFARRFSGDYPSLAAGLCSAGLRAAWELTRPPGIAMTPEDTHAD